VSCRKALILLPALAAAAPAIHAETLYVIEQLVVNVNSAPDGSGERVANIKSGDAVEVVESQGDQIHVHLANGKEGWIKKSYLSAEEPLQHRLSESKAEVEKLKQDVTRLQGELAAARTGSPGKAGPTTNMSAGSPVTKSGSPAATPSPATRPAPAPTPAQAPPASAASSDGDSAPAETRGADSPSDPTPGEPAYFMTPPDAPAHPVWHWAVGSFVVALALGFALGWQMLDRRIRRKYGGVRIY
jgi:hypothetical protein